MKGWFKGWFKRKPGTPDMVEKTVTVNGQQRIYRYYVPPVLARPTPVVLGFEAPSAPWVPVADQYGFILCNPSPVNQRWPSEYLTAQNVLPYDDDLVLAQVMVDQLGLDYELGPVYGTGFSGGDSLIWRIAAETELLAGYAGSSGAMGKRALGYTEWKGGVPGTGTRPLAVWHFHGGQDTLTPVRGGVRPGPEGQIEVTSVAYGIETWATFVGATVPGVCPAVQLPSGQFWGWVNPNTGIRVQAHIEGARRHAYPDWAPPHIWAFWTSCP